MLFMRAEFSHQRWHLEVQYVVCIHVIQLKNSGFKSNIVKNNATLAHRENVFELHKGVSILEIVIATLKQYFTVEFFSSQSLIYSL